MADISTINMDKVLTEYPKGETVVDLLEDLQAARDLGEGTKVQKPFRDKLRVLGWYMNNMPKEYLLNGKPSKSVTKKMAKTSKRKNKMDKNYIMVDGKAYSPDNVPKSVTLKIPRKTVPATLNIVLIVNGEENKLTVEEGEVIKVSLE